MFNSHCLSFHKRQVEWTFNLLFPKPLVKNLIWAVKMRNSVFIDMISNEIKYRKCLRWTFQLLDRIFNSKPHFPYLLEVTFLMQWLDKLGTRTLGGICTIIEICTYFYNIEILFKDENIHNANFTSYLILFMVRVSLESPQKICWEQSNLAIGRIPISLWLLVIPALCLIFAVLAPLSLKKLAKIESMRILRCLHTHTVI